MGLASMLLGFCGIPVYTKLSHAMGKKRAMIAVHSGIHNHEGYNNDCCSHCIN